MPVDLSTLPAIDGQSLIDCFWFCVDGFIQLCSHRSPIAKFVFHQQLPVWCLYASPHIHVSLWWHIDETALYWLD